MRYRFVTADVFTATPFAGNPLAVLLDARGLETAQMQAIAREFNLAETVFVLPPEMAGHARRLRIFTPAREIPFAGHPTIGAALVLAELGAIALAGPASEIVLGEAAGPVPVTIRMAADGTRMAQLTAPAAPSLRPGPSVEDAAALLSLAPDDLVTARGLPVQASCGLPFILIEVRDRGALGRARFDHGVFARRFAGGWAEFPYVLTADAPAGADLQVRMFAPSGGVPEDPATGSAAAAYGGWLGGSEPLAEGTLQRVILQGIELGRPSRLEVEVDKRAGAVAAVRVAGSAVLISEGTILAPPAR
jgi:trans-2,3-dihydro-3-hydroxyanthranilate isomerase